MEEEMFAMIPMDIAERLMELLDEAQSIIKDERERSGDATAQDDLQKVADTLAHLEQRLIGFSGIKKKTPAATSSAGKT